MKQNKSLEAYGEMPVPKAVISNVVPAIVAMLMVLVYNLADTFFVGQTHDDLQVAAVSLATPVFLLFMAIGTVFGAGGTSVISRAMGEGRADYAKKVSAFCMWSCVVVGIAMSALIAIFMNPILTAVGASDQTRELAGTYLGIVILCGPMVLISTCFSNILRAEGQSTNAMMGTIIGNILNVVLDPIMILLLGWNIAGAAIATVVGNVAGAVYYIVYFLRGHSSLSISIKDFTMKDKVFSSVMSIGVPASLGSIMLSLSQVVMNSMMAGYGDMAVAAIGVAMKVTMIATMVFIGLGQGVQPLLGFCVGAKNFDRYKHIMRFSLILAAVVGVVLTGLCYLLVEQIVGMFLTDPSAFEYGVTFSRILLCTCELFGFFFVFINAMQATGDAVGSLVVNLSRQGIIYIPALFILRAVMGANGLVWAQPIVDVLSLLLSFVLYRRALNKRIRMDME